mgnify:FL=1
MPLSAQQLVKVSDRYPIAAIRQLIKAHNRFDDLMVPKKLKKDELIKYIDKKGFKLSATGQPRLTQMRTQKKTSLDTAVQMKKKGYKNNRSGY